VATPPTFTSGTSASTEATTSAGASFAGIYTPTAVDYTGASLSSSIQTFLVSTGAQIQLSGTSAYIFPRGSTLIRNSVTNSAGLTAQQTVNITVVDTIKPEVTVDATPIVVTQAPNGTLQTISWPANKVSVVLEGRRGFVLDLFAREWFRRDSCLGPYILSLNTAKHSPLTSRSARPPTSG
jgi:hypothetical protein